MPNIFAIAVSRACSPEGVWEAVTNSTYAPCGLHGDHIAVSILTTLYLIKTKSNVTLLSLSRVKCSLRPVCVYFCALKPVVELHFTGDAQNVRLLAGAWGESAAQMVSLPPPRRVPG